MTQNVEDTYNNSKFNVKLTHDEQSYNQQQQQQHQQQPQNNISMSVHEKQEKKKNKIKPENQYNVHENDDKTSHPSVNYRKRIEARFPPSSSVVFELDLPSVIGWTLYIGFLSLCVSAVIMGQNKTHVEQLEAKVSYLTAKLEAFESVLKSQSFKEKDTSQNPPFTNQYSNNISNCNILQEHNNNNNNYNNNNKTKILNITQQLNRGVKLLDSGEKLSKVNRWISIFNLTQYLVPSQDMNAFIITANTSKVSSTTSLTENKNKHNNNNKNPIKFIKGLFSFLKRSKKHEKDKSYVTQQNIKENQQHKAMVLVPSAEQTVPGKLNPMFLKINDSKNNMENMNNSHLTPIDMRYRNGLIQVKLVKNNEKRNAPRPPAEYRIKFNVHRICEGNNK